MFPIFLNKIKKTFPIIEWVSKYNVENAIADIIAGITIGLTLIPQSIAYAGLAGLPPQYGLYSSLCGGWVYAIFGTVPEINIAPTALLSLLTLTYTTSVSFGAVPAAVLLCFCAGIIEVFCGLLHLGFLVDFVSIPAVVGLTSAAAILIASLQVKNMFGMQSLSNRSFIGTWKDFFQNIAHIRLQDSLLSLCCCCFLLLFRKLKKYGTPPVSLGNNDQKGRRKFKILLWFLCVSRNAFVVIISTIVSYFVIYEEKYYFHVTGHIDPGLPNISSPIEIVVNNSTLTIFDMVKELGTGIVVLPFIAIIANVAIAKSFSKGKVLDASQEMLAVGFCNIVASFVSSIPVNGSFGRAAVSSASGVRTPLAGIYTSIMVLLSLTFLTPFFAYIPKATLASIVICAVIFMVEITTSKQIWKLNKIDALPLVVTFFACLLLGVEIGILIGVGVDLLLLLYYISRPHVIVQRVIIQGKEYVKITPPGSIFYPTAEFLRQRIVKNEVFIDKCKEGNIIIIDCSKLANADFTTAKCLGSLAEELGKVNKTIAFLKLTPHLTKLLAKTCRNCIFAFSDEILIEMLKERRYSDILDSYKSIKVETGEINIEEFTVITSK